MSARVAGLVMIGRFFKHEKLDQKARKKGPWPSAAISGVTERRHL